MSQRYWEVLEERDVGQLHIVIDKSYDELHPQHCFDESCYDIEDICRKIDAYELDWFILRARVFYEDVELGDHIVGGFLYEDAREVLVDGTADDVVYGAMEEAKKRAGELKTKFMELEVDKIEF